MADATTRRVAEFGMGRPAGRALIRSSNLGLVLRTLRTEGELSRAGIATLTGLSKATISSLIADLVDRGLVLEGMVDRNGQIGRPGLGVELDPGRVVGIGVEINVDYLALTVVDLCGEVVEQRQLAIDTPALTASDTLAAVADLLRPVVAFHTDHGRHVAGVFAAVPGTIDPETHRVSVATTVGWRDVEVIDSLASALGLPVARVGIENDAKLAAVAAHAQTGGDNLRDLIYLTGDAGVGAGIICDGVLQRGHAGHSGEIGHLPLDPTGRQCPCGRTGCWELVVGLPNFLALCAEPDDEVHDLRVPVEHRLAVLRGRALAGDPRVGSALQVVGAALGIGISVVVDLLDPQCVVLGGYFAWFEEWFVPEVTSVLRSRLLDPRADPVTITVSRLGLSAAAHGGARLALETVFEDPVTVDPAQRSSPTPSPRVAVQ